jgi:5'/3'-nucleotidase
MEFQGNSEVVSVRQSRQRVLLLLLILFLAAPEAFPAGRRSAAGSGLTLLLSNDDGYDAPGLQILIQALKPVGDVYVAAPAVNQSGKGQSVTGSRYLYVHEKAQPDGRTFYAIEATPATCVRLALEALMPKKPDVVISGINRGENLGFIVYYSGTLGAAREAAMSGIPALAVSMQGDQADDYQAAAAYVRSLLEQLRDKHLLKSGFFLNVNVPAGQPKGVRVTKLSTTRGRQVYNRHSDNEGRPYYEQSWQPVNDDDDETDVWAFARGFITLTPMMLDTTASKSLDGLRSLERESVGSAAR